MQTGTQIGKYFIGKKLGAGGMADVYLATDSTMGREVALKVLPPEFARDPERVHRFQKEVQASAALSHPNIIPVYDVGEAQAEGFTYNYYTMALLPSGDLKQRIEQGLTPEQSLSIIKAIADALGYAHDKGLVHRDIKPENILFDESERPILTDLGIAKAINSGTKMTGTGMSIGTPHYMSPEQAKGESDLDGRSDIYALGIMLFEMLTGQVPYKGDNTMAVGIMHIQNPLPELPQHLNQYQGLLNNCLAKDKANRYQHTQDLIGDIDKLRQGQKVKASQKTRVLYSVSIDSKNSSNQALKWGLGGAITALALLLSTYFLQLNTEKQINTVAPTNLETSLSSSGSFTHSEKQNNYAILDKDKALAAELDKLAKDFMENKSYIQNYKEIYELIQKYGATENILAVKESVEVITFDDLYSQTQELLLSEKYSEAEKNIKILTTVLNDNEDVRNLEDQLKQKRFLNLFLVTKTKFSNIAASLLSGEGKIKEASKKNLIYLEKIRADINRLESSEFAKITRYQKALSELRSDVDLVLDTVKLQKELHSVGGESKKTKANAEHEQKTNTKDFLSDVHALPEDIQMKLPSLSFSTHMFSIHSDKRWVRVNGAKAYEGDIVDGVKIVEIEENHTVLRFDEYLFKMTALSDW